MKVLVTGSSGFIGMALVADLAARGNEVLRLVRRQPRDPREFRWDIASGHLDRSALEGIDAAVHLAGENVGAGRWSDERRRRILESRVGGTRALCDALARLARPPEVLISASAIGYYGDRGDAVLTEESPAGSGFLAEVVRRWEAATEAARQRGIRVVNLRFGVVLSPGGGVLARLLPYFRLGLGGALGSGRQYMSWLTLDDALGIVRHAMATHMIAGPVNAVAPGAVTNGEFTQVLGRVLHRPTLLRIPEFALRLVLGQMAEETLLASTRARPTRLLASGYRFRHPELESALLALLYGPA